MNNAIYSDYSPMKWNQEHSIEVFELDGQHKELMNFYNETLKKCSGKETAEREYFDKTIDVFIASLEKHFTTEEQLLSGKNYARSDEHKLEHLKLLEKIRLMKEEIQNGRWTMKLHILAITLKDMLLFHFNSYDMNAKEYFGEGGALRTDSPRTDGTETYFAFQA